MIRLAPVVLLLILGEAGAPRARERPMPPADWKTVTAIQDEGLTVRVNVLRQASLADARWLTLELENTSKVPVSVRSSDYRFESEQVDRKTGKRLLSGGLASGNDPDMFPAAWKTTPVSPRILPPETVYDIDTHPSQLGSSSLGLPPRDGVRVRARFHFRLELDGGRSYRTPAEGITLEFDWLFPEPAGFATVRTRLKKALASPTPDESYYLLSKLLRTPEIAWDITRDDLLAALSQWQECQCFQREVVARHLGRRHGKDTAVLAYYRTRIGAAALRWGLLDDLWRTDGVWDASFVEPLVRLYESDPSEYSHALVLLHAHRGDWVANQHIARRLSAATFNLFPEMKQGMDALHDEDRLLRWTVYVNRLGMTGDPAVIELLQPVLDDRRPVSPRVMGPTPDPNSAPWRHCDFALEALLHLLKGNANDFFFADARVGEEDKVRDRLIEDMKRHLSDRKSRQEPPLK